MNAILVLALPLFLASTACGQPDEALPTSVTPPAPALPNSTPAGTVRNLITSLQNTQTKSYPYRELTITSAVQGAHARYFGGEEWTAAFNDLLRFSTDVDDVHLDSQDGDEATITVSSHVTLQEQEPGGPLKGKRFDTSETLHLRLDRVSAEPSLKNTWRIVPTPVEEVLALAHPFQTPPLQLAAVLATRDPRLLPFIRQEIATDQLKRLDLGVIQLVQDFAGVYAFDDAALERALWPYTKNDSIYAIAGTKDERWHFNDHLSRLSSATIKEPFRTVLFYDGSAPDSEHLNFRFGGKTLVYFVGRRAAALSRDEVKDLIWNP